ALALQAPVEAPRIDVLADAQQEKVYVQSFARAETGAWAATSPLRIRTVADWLAERDPGAWVTGPGLRVYGNLLPEAVSHGVAAAAWDPQAGSIWRLGLARERAGERHDLWTLEPLYLRPSSAEEKWQQRSCS